MESSKKYYRCGYCGCPTDENGEPLSPDEIKEWNEKDAILVHGTCCLNEIHQQERETVIVTRDMAIDAQDMSLEGQKWIW